MIHFGHESLGGSMRGRFRDQGGLFSYIAGDAGARRASSAGNQGAGAGGSEGPRSELRQALCQRGAAVDPAGAIAERLAASGVLLDPLGTPTDGAARL